MQAESESLFHGITEVLQAILLCDSQSIYSHDGRHIKVCISSLDDEAEDGPQLYSVKVTSNRGMDFKEFNKQGIFENLTAVIKKTHEHSTECLLCVVSQVDSHERTKDLFRICESNSLQCSESTVLPAKPSAYLKICFQAMQGKEEMAGECQKLHSFLHRVKMFNPQLHILFQLHLFGIDCDRTDICSDMEYLTDSVCEKEMLPALVITPSYYLRNKEAPCSSVHVKQGVCVPLKHLIQADLASQGQLQLQATAVLVPYRQRVQDSSHGFINLMFTYSGYIPVDSTAVPTWKPDNVSNIFHMCECQSCENPDPFQSPVQLHVMCTEHSFIKQQRSYVMYVILDIKSDEHISQGSMHKLYVLNWHRAMLSQLFGFWKDELQLAVDSAVKSIWCTEFMIRNKTPFEGTLSQAIPLTTDSVLSIVTSSTDENFRQACFSSLEVNNACDLRKVLSKKLLKLATDKYQRNTESEPHCQDNQSQKNDEQDCFDELGVHEESIGTRIDTSWSSEFYENSDYTVSVDAKPWTKLAFDNGQEENKVELIPTNDKEDRESSSQEWYEDSIEDLDSWMEE